MLQHTQKTLNFKVKLLLMVVSVNLRIKLSLKLLSRTLGDAQDEICCKYRFNPLTSTLNS